MSVRSSLARATRPGVPTFVEAPMAAKITVHWLLCGMLCWLFASPVYADTILDVDMSNLLFQAAAGNNSCSGLPCEETFNITFQWDNTTGLLVPATINVSGTGALSSADLSGPWRWIEGTNGTINYLIIGELSYRSRQHQHR